jgi:hypothetical protein
LDARPVQKVHRELVLSLIRIGRLQFPSYSYTAQ